MVTIVSTSSGDYNEPAEKVAELARAAGGRLVRGRGVDHLILAVEGPGQVQVGEVVVLPKGRSDHHPLLIPLTIDGVQLDHLVWNVYVGQPRDYVRPRLRRLIRRHRPRVVSLQEAYGLGPMLARLAEATGYHLIHGPNTGEAADCALLIRDDRRLASHGRVRMRTRWTGPKHGRAKAPREYPRGRQRLAPGPDGIVLRALVVHQPTGGTTGRNGDAVAESRRRITRWLTQPQHTTRRTKEKSR